MVSSAIKEEAQDAVTTLLELQARYVARIHEANAAGDANAVQHLLAELDQKTRTMSAVTPALHVVAEGGGSPTEQNDGGADEPEQAFPSLYDQDACIVDLDLLVYDGDRDLHQALAGDEHFAAVAARLLAGAEPNDARKNLLCSALKLTPLLAPDVYAILGRCRESLGLAADVELHVWPDTAFKAFCYPPVSGRYVVGVTSALLERFTADELAFVIGREIGHALFGHDRLPVSYLLAEAQDELSPLDAMRLYAWKRNAALSADRIGLVCARSFDAAAQAFFKLSAGVTTAPFTFSLKEYVAQVIELENVPSTQAVDPEDWFSAHPFSPMRLKALDLFQRSETYLRLQGREAHAELSEEQLEFEIKKVMAPMEPTYLQETTETGALMRDVLFFGGYLVAAANGIVEDAEIETLATLLDLNELEERLGAVKTLAHLELEARFAAITESLNLNLPVVAKLNVARDLALIARADGEIDATELEMLYALTTQLGIRPAFVDRILADVRSTEGARP